MQIIIQLIGVVAMAANFLSFQFKKHKNIMLFRTLNESLFILQYFLLGALTGATLNFVGCIRNVIFARRVEKGKSTRISGLIFCLFFILFGIFTFDGFKSIIMIIAKVLSTVAYGNKNTTIIRTVSFLTHVTYLIYNLCVFSIAGAVSDGIVLVSLIFGILRFDILPRLKNRA